MKIYCYLMLAALCISAHNCMTASQAPAKTAASTRRPSQAIVQNHWPQPTQVEVWEFLDAAFKDHQKIFESLQKYGPNIVNKKTFGNCPVLEAAASDHLTLEEFERIWTPEEFERLLQTPGIDIDNGSILTPLTKAMLTASGGDPDDNQLKKIDLLIKHGADINLANSNGFTPLIKAALNNQPKVVSMLLHAGASTDGKVIGGGWKGKTFFDFAQRHPAVQKAYDDYKQEIAALATEPLGGIRDLGNIVSEYAA